jgi:hypothetical protein
MTIAYELIVGSLVVLAAIAMWRRQTVFDEGLKKLRDDINHLNTLRSRSLLMALNAGGKTQTPTVVPFDAPEVAPVSQAKEEGGVARDRVDVGPALVVDSNGSATPPLKNGPMRAA